MGRIVRAAVVAVIVSVSLVSAQDATSSVAQSQIDRLAIQLVKAEKAGNAKKARYIRYQIRIQRSIVALEGK